MKKAIDQLDETILALKMNGKEYDWDVQYEVLRLKSTKRKSKRDFIST